MTEITETCDGSHHAALSAALLMKETILIAVQKSGSGKLLYSLQTVACSEPLANQTNDHYESLGRVFVTELINLFFRQHAIHGLHWFR